MGGKALSIHSSRVDAREYARIADEVTAAATLLLPAGGAFQVIPHYRSKADFGDLDALYHTGEGDGGESYAFAQSLMAALKFTEFHKNGACISFGYPLAANTIFQIDLIKSNPREFDFSLQYFSWNDTGNLLGRNAHKMGFKFGHKGLLYHLKAGDHLFAELVITQNFAEALTFLGYDPQRFALGFDTPDDIFAFVVSTPHFDTYYYALENMNHYARIRDAKRPVYHAFLAWLEANPHIKALPQPTPEEKIKLKQQYLQAACEAFPDFAHQLETARANLAQSQENKGKFNGEIVASITQLSGKELGQFIAAFKAHIEMETGSAFQDWLTRNTPSDIVKSVGGFNVR